MTRRGFTLIEVLAAIALLLVLSGSLVSFGRALADRSAWTQRTAQDVRACTVVFDQIGSALRTCEVGGGSLGPGVQGDAGSLTVLCRTEPGEGADLARLRLRYEGGSVRFAFGPADGDGSDEVLTDRVEAVRVRYHDGRGWQGSFDSVEADRLPLAVEVSIWLGRRAATDAEGPTRAPDRRRVFAVPGAATDGGRP